MKNLTEQTQYGTFNFTFNENDEVFAKKAINDALFSQNSWVSAELPDFANVFGKTSLIKVERYSLQDKNQDLLAILANKRSVGIIFYCSAMSDVTRTLKSLKPEGVENSPVSFMKAFSTENSPELEGSFAVFY